MTEPNNENQSSAVFIVAVGLPPFWPDRPTLWFVQQKPIRAGSYHAPTNQVKLRGERLNNFTGARALRPAERLVRQLSTSREQRVRELLTHDEMGDRKQSQVLRHLKDLAPDVPDDFLRTVWTSRYSQHVKAILADQVEGSLDSVFHFVDKIFEVTSQPTAASMSSTTPDNTAGLLESIEELSCQVTSPRVSQTHNRLHF